MYISSPMWTRKQFGDYLNEKGLKGRAVEIGTHRGEFANSLMQSWQGNMLHCIDHWSIPKGYEEQAECLPAKGATRDDDYRHCAQTLLQYHGRVLLHKATSEEMCREFKHNTIDFIYIDGDHSYQAVYNDLVSWWQKVKVGGILAGHDWLCPGEHNGGWGRNIQPAVALFMKLFSLDIHLIVEAGGLPWTYYTVKQ